MRILTSILIITQFIFLQLNAQQLHNKLVKKPPVSQKIYNEIAHMDSVLFNAYNNQNIELMKTCFSKDLEWYQDNGGLILYDQVFKNFETILARPEKITRKWLDSTMEVYPIKNYGAVQTGEHLFCHKENGKDDCGIFKFVMVWQQKNGEYKITRVISYDH